MNKERKTSNDLYSKALNYIKKRKKHKNLKQHLKRMISRKHESNQMPKEIEIDLKPLESPQCDPSTSNDISDDRSTDSSASMKNSPLIADKCEKCCSLREVVALDCEFVGCGSKGRINALGRATIVDYDGNILYDQIALPDREIIDFRTPWSGLRPRDFINAIPEEFVKRKVIEILKDKIVVGHMLKNDFRVLQYSHDRHLVRDTALYAPIRQLNGAHPQDKRPMALKKLSKYLLNREIQTHEHDSAEDAIASLDLYKLVESSWEAELHSDASTNSDSLHQSTIDDSQNLSWFDDQFWPEDD